MEFELNLTVTVHAANACRRLVAARHAVNTRLPAIAAYIALADSRCAGGEIF